MVSPKKICAECGGEGVPHFFIRATVFLGIAVESLSKPFLPLGRRLSITFLPAIERYLVAFFRLLAFFRLARILEEPDAQDVARTTCLWVAAEKRGIAMREFRLFGRPTNIFFSEFRRELVVFEGLPRPNKESAESLAWMDNKAQMKKKFLAAGIPVAKGDTAFSLGEAIRLFRTLCHPVITKPHVGSRSRHTTIHIGTEEGLRRAFRVAKELSPLVLIEEELSGFVYRITLIGGKVAGVLRREPPYVIGDGLKTVIELIRNENKNPKRHGPIFHEIAEDEAAAEELARQNLTWESVPANGRFVSLNQKVGRSQAGTNTNVTSEVHPENRALFEKIGRVLADSVVGIDFIMEDIGKPWREQARCGVIECNSLPFLDLHASPYRGEPLDLSSLLWDIVYPHSKVKTPRE